MHNSFDVYPLESGGFMAKSHNFKDIEGKGETEDSAISTMNRAIIYLRDNDRQSYDMQIKARADNKLECLCGVKLTSSVVGYL